MREVLPGDRLSEGVVRWSAGTQQGQYADLDLGAADASVVALAERLKITRISTVDRRDLTVVRPKHAAAFELLPDLTP